MGKWKVAVHDNTRLYQPWEKPYFVLSAGDVYNMKTRRIEKLGTGATGEAGRGGKGLSEIEVMSHEFECSVSTAPNS